MNTVEPVEDDKVITEEPKKAPKAEAFPLSVGLKELLKTDKIVIQQMSGLLNSCICCYDGENIFEIADRLGHIILRAKEDSSCCYRQSISD